MSLRFYIDTIESLGASGNLRTIPGATQASGLIDLSSNDYLGLADDEELRREFFASRDVSRLPMTSAASRLLAGTQEEHTSLENYLGELYGRPVLLANSGYHANVGQVSALCSAPGTLIVADKLVHASIIDGIRLSGAPFERFRHNDINHLETILRRKASGYDRVWVITESVFSMDGDRAPIDDLVRIKSLFPNVLLYIDEAHAFGVEGERGLGICRSSSGYEQIDVVVGTLGKAAASMGAFAAVSPQLKSYLVNRSRAHIFSTALPPLQSAWSEFVIRKITLMDDRRAHLRQLGAQLGEILGSLGSRTEGSHIQPLIVGDPKRAVALSEAMRKEGFKVLPIRVPTVPPGTDRLRISLNANLSAGQIAAFCETLKRVLE